MMLPFLNIENSSWLGEMVGTQRRNSMNSMSLRLDMLNLKGLLAIPIEI